MFWNNKLYLGYDTVVRAQLAEQLLLTLDDLGSNTVIGIFERLLRKRGRDDPYFIISH